MSRSTEKDGKFEEDTGPASQVTSLPHIDRVCKLCGWPLA